MSNKIKKENVFETESGETLPLMRVSQIDLIPFESMMSEGAPQPPLEEVDTADGIRLIPNPARQDFKDEMSRFQTKRSVFMIAVIVELGVDIELSAEQLAQVDKARKKLAKIYPDSASNLENTFETFLYVKSICPTMDELRRLSDAIVSINMPTAGQVQEHLDSFRSGVPGPALDVDQDAAIWDNITVGVN